MKNNDENSVKHCVICGTWTTLGVYIQSGPRSWLTGRVPFENWICAVCDKQADDWRQVDMALDEWARSKDQPGA